jgi:hypothetical protein
VEPFGSVAAKLRPRYLTGMSMIGFFSISRSMDPPDFDDDFIDDSESEGQPNSRAYAPAEEEDSDHPILPELGDDQEEDLDESLATDIFTAVEKVSALDLSLKKSIELSNTETNQLYALLFCVNDDCEKLLVRHRLSIPFSIQAEASAIKEVKYDHGVLRHRKFGDGFNTNGISDRDAQALIAFIGFRCSVAQRALIPVVSKACELLKDPLIRAHNTLRALKQKISDLKKSNIELTLQTRQTANRLVRISKSGKDVDTEGLTDKSDVIIHQQRLQKMLTRVCNLKEAIESASAGNSDLQSKLGRETARIPDAPLALPPHVIELQKHVSAMKANLEQSEDDRETAMAQRRVSIARMNSAIQKLEEEKRTIAEHIGFTENKIRIMTQGQKEGPLPEKKKSAPRVPGSKIPVFSPDRAPPKLPS